jgi:hypothetical protein
VLLFSFLRESKKKRMNTKMTYKKRRMLFERNGGHVVTYLFVLGVPHRSTTHTVFLVTAQNKESARERSGEA